ncbi:MAG: LysR family transcriptional regulator [Candidatus Bathyarchaeia archaeon]
MRKKRFGRTLLTEEEVKVLDALLRCGNVTEAAKELGKAQPTVSIVKKRIEDKIDVAIETLKLALSREYINLDELLRLVASAETYIEIKKRLSEDAEKEN